MKSGSESRKPIRNGNKKGIMYEPERIFGENIKMRKTIMIVEDEHRFQELYTTLLEDTDYEIIQAYDGDEALELLEERKPDLIVLDILLDMVTGDTFFLYLKGMPDRADIPVIVVSNTSKHDYRNLLDIDPNLVFLDKALVAENLIKEIKARIG